MSTAQRRISSILVFAMGSYVVIACAIVAVAAAFIEYDNARTESEAALTNRSTADLTVGYIDRTLETLALFASVVTDRLENEALITGDNTLAPERTAALVAQMLSDSTDPPGYIVSNAEGTVIAASDPERIGADIADRPYFNVQRVSETAGFIGDPEAADVTGGVSVPVSWRITAPDGSFMGVLVLNMLSRSVRDFLYSAGLPQGGLIAVTRPNGEPIMMSPNSEAVLDRSLPVWSLVEEFTRQPDRQLPYQIRDLVSPTGEESTWLYAAAVSNVGDLRVVSAQTGQAVFISWRRTALWLIGITTIVLVGIAGLTVMIVRSVMSERDALNSLEVERDRAQAESERAKRADQAKSQFLAVMSHEIRTPLTTVAGMNDLLHDTTLDKQQGQYLRTQRSAVRGLLALVDDILDMARLESGRLELESIDFDLRDVLGDVVTVSRPRAEKKGIAFDLSYPEEAPRWFTGDPHRLKQILLNFSSNAAKFTEFGRIELSAAIGPETDGRHHVVIEVRDTGPGIDADQQKGLFQVFYQAEAGTSRKYGGSGLGLSITKELAQLMGGEVGFRPNRPHGSVFWLSVPLVPCAVPKEEPKGTAARDKLRPLTIMLAEDHKPNQMLMAEILRRSGHTIVTAGDGQEAVDEAEKQPFDVILMDIQMPKLDGIQAMQAIKAGDGPNRTTPVVALTANAVKEDHELYLADGMTACVTKPVDWKALFDLFVELLPEAVGAVAGPEMSGADNGAKGDFAMTDAHALDPALDSTVVASLEEAIGADTLEVLMEGLLEEVRNTAEAFRTRIADDTEVRRTAHTMKGAAANYGAVAIAALMAEAEDKGAPEGGPQALGERLDQEIGRLESAWQAHLKGGSEARSHTG
ncbi:MAG: ATP-binding protein [Azospirillaceae bacterium]